MAKFNSLEKPCADKTTQCRYSVDVLILYNSLCFIGYFHFSSNEWRYNCSKVNEEKTFLIVDPDDLKWLYIKQPNQAKAFKPK